MLFSLEVLQAKFGDCLLLHYGKNKAHDVMVIDGGPAGVYRNFLKPRLLELKQSLAPESALPLSMVMVSHMDDDHVNGVLAMTDDMLDIQEDNKHMPFELNHFWFNTFDDIIGNFEIPKIAALPASASAADISNILGSKHAEEWIAAVIASTSQGRQLRKKADALSAEVNDPFTKRKGVRLVRGDKNESEVEWDEGLKITVVHPNEERLQEYEKKWDEDLKKAKKAGDDSIMIASIVDEDTSPFNLSSIVCLVEYGGKRILLTGDARCDDMLAGLNQNGLLDENGKLHVDILKLPHHGSVRNANESFYEQVTADHYVVSANGKYHNPDQEMLELLVRVLKKGDLHFTNKTGENGLKEKMAKFEKALKEKKSKLKIHYREEGNNSFVIDLGKALNI